MINIEYLIVVWSMETRPMEGRNEKRKVAKPLQTRSVDQEFVQLYSITTYVPECCQHSSHHHDTVLRQRYVYYAE